MNYAIAVFGIMLVVAVGFWIVKGRFEYLRSVDAIERIAVAQRLEGVTPANAKDY